MEFKIGDWVRYKGICRINHITHTGYHLSNGYITKGDNGEMKHWKPQPNEWCWFYDSDKQPQLGKSTGVTPDSEDCDFFIGNVTYPFNISHLIEGFNCCEPFIGELPTILKNQ